VAKQQMTMATATGKVVAVPGATLADQARARAVAVLSGAAKRAENAPIRITITPASFVGKDGKPVVGVRVGKHFLVPEHIDALLTALGIPADTIDPDRYAALFES